MSTAMKQSIASPSIAAEPKLQFYRRQLPDSCVSFSSPLGKQIFQESMQSGHMECYFKLAAQFRTQDEPAFCGLTTLVMVLNALEIDPGRVWKGPWRWYHENMLDCCVPVKVIEQEGITFGQFVCLAQCNGLETTATSVDEGASLDKFRDLIEKLSKQDETIITLSYSRKILSQTGDGHFSPIGGYHPERDLVLILDTARFKYPPHWVPVTVLFDAMKELDKTTGRPRGYVLMRRPPSLHPLALFRISESLVGVPKKSGCCGKMNQALTKWKKWLTNVDESINLENILAHAVLLLVDAFAHVAENQRIFTTQMDSQCCKEDSKIHLCIIKQLTEELENSQTFAKVANAFSSHDIPTGNNFLCVSKDVTGTEMDCFPKLNAVHFVAMFLLSWPYQTSLNYAQGTNSFKLNGLVLETLQTGSWKYLDNEIRLLRKQLSVLLFNSGQCCK